MNDAGSGARCRTGNAIQYALCGKQRQMPHGRCDTQMLAERVDGM